MWMAGVALLSMRLVAECIGIERLKRATRVVDEAMSARVVSLAHRLGIERTVRVFESTLVQVPTWLAGCGRSSCSRPASSPGCRPPISMPCSRTSWRTCVATTISSTHCRPLSKRSSSITPRSGGARDSSASSASTVATTSWWTACGDRVVLRDGAGSTRGTQEVTADAVSQRDRRAADRSGPSAAGARTCRMTVARRPG